FGLTGRPRRRLLHYFDAQAGDDRESTDAKHQPEDARGPRLAKCIADQPGNHGPQGGADHARGLAYNSFNTRSRDFALSDAGPCSNSATGPMWRSSLLTRTAMRSQSCSISLSTCVTRRTVPP